MSQCKRHGSMRMWLISSTPLAGTLLLFCKRIAVQKDCCCYYPNGATKCVGIYPNTSGNDMSASSQMLRISFRTNYKGFKNEFSDVFRNTSTDVSKPKFPPQSLYPEDKFLDDDPGLAFAFSRLQKISLMANHHQICNRIAHIKIWHQMRFLQDPPSAKTNQPADT
jgi:hypothetical protein